MQISWYGQSCFKIESRGVTVAVDPFVKPIGLTPPRFRADVILVTHGHPDHANADAIQGDPFLINGPGEYEVKGVVVRGVQTFHDKVGGKERGANTAYIIDIEDIKICHLGDFGEQELREETLEQLGDIDIMMIPVGGTFTIDGKEAAHIVGQAEPRAVIPMHYKIPGLAVPLAGREMFLKEMGAKDGEPLDKLVIKKKDLPEEETRIIVLRTA